MKQSQNNKQTNKQKESEQKCFLQKHFQIDQSQTAIDGLSAQLELSRQQIKQAMQNGAVWLENAQGIHRIRRAKKILQSGDQLHVYYAEEIQQSVPEPAELIADEGDYSVWNKPSGMYSQGTRWGDHCSIYRWAETHLQPQRPAYLVHRLDRAASGLILLAHGKKAAAQLAQLFEQREIYKEYTALVEGEFKADKLPMCIEQALDNKPALSEILSAQFDTATNTTRLQISIHTGRKHQIRRHLCGLGYPIVGDRLYGAKNLSVDLQLTSILIKFRSPLDGEEKSYCL